jgi:hypothetical protein
MSRLDGGRPVAPGGAIAGYSPRADGANNNDWSTAWLLPFPRVC